MSIHFISDLHLSAAQPVVTKLFITYLENQARDADALFILGDLFEAWLGDDMVLPEYQDAIQSIIKLTGSGVPVYIMYGNRDFLMREDFEQQTGAQLINDPTLIDLFGTPTLLMHGDTLCTDDTEYQAFRQMVRDPNWQAELLAKTPQQRLDIARQYRETSKSKTSNKRTEIMDVNQDEVLSVLKKYDARQLIHGHTHRPDTHQFNIDGNATTRIVLADWRESGEFLACDESGCQRHAVN